MKGVIVLLVCWALQSAYAEKPISWYPDNSDEISEKCYQDNELSSDVINNLQNKTMCQAKSIGAYKENRGLDVEQFTNSYYRFTKSPKCRQFLVQDCIDDHKFVEAPGEKLFKEDRNTKKLQSLKK